MERWRTDAGSFLRQRVLFGRVPIVLYMRAGSRPGEAAEGTVPDEDEKRAAHRTLVDRVLDGEGRASRPHAAAVTHGLLTCVRTPTYLYKQVLVQVTDCIDERRPG
jgi:hypothetical protein